MSSRKSAGSGQVRSRLLNVVLVGACWWWLPTRAVAQQSAVLASGDSIPGRLVQTGETLGFSAEPGSKVTHSLRLVRSISIASPATHLLSTGPLRQIHFSGGDRLTGEVLSAGNDRWNIRSRGLIQHHVPRAAIGAIVQPASKVLQLYEDFTTSSEKSTRPDDPMAHSAPQCLRLEAGKSRDWPLRNPLSMGSVQIWFWGTSEQTEWGVELRGPSPATEKIRVLLGNSENVYNIEGGTFSIQGIRRTGGWHCLSCLIDRERMTVSVDGALLADGLPCFSAISQIRLFNQETATQATDVRFDDLLVVEHVPDKSLPVQIPALRQDLVVQRSGDALFGRIVEVSPLRVRLQGPLDTLTLPWHELHSVAWGDQPAGTTIPVSGQFARIELTSDAELGDAATDVLTGAITKVTATELEFEHPWLGKLRLPLRQIQRIIPDGQGRRVLLDGRRHHLGDEVRPDFARQVPEGSVLSVPLILDKLPIGESFVLVNATDLEPAGPLAVPSPFLDQLRQGHLTTELLVNDVKVSDLNRFVGQKVTGPPVRLRIAVPAKFWKLGANVLKFVQRPQLDERSSFDDCELSEIILETSR